MNFSLTDKQSIKDSLIAYLERSKGISISIGKPFQCVFPENHRNYDSNPSMSVYRDYSGTLKAHCFACNCEVDTLDLIMNDYNCSYTEAYEKGLEFIGKNSYFIQQITPKKIPVRAINESNTDFSKEVIELNSSLQGNIQHFKDRGLSENIINTYKLGYSSLGWNYAFRNFPELKTEAQKQDLYKYFFCNISKEGKVDYIFSEISDRNKIDEFNQKYRFPKGLQKPIFNERYLYEDSQVIFIVEGIYDSLSFEEIGLKSIALLGSGNKRLCHILADNESNNKYIILLDNDKTGKEESLKLAKELSKLGINYKLGTDFFPEGIKDSNEFLIKDKNNFILQAKKYTSELTKTQISNFKEKVKGRTYEYIPTHIKAIDNSIQGLNKQELVVIQAVAGIGKTTLCQQIAENFASSGRKVLYFNLEMSVEQLIARSLSRIIGNCLEDYTISPVNILQGYKWNTKQEEIIDSAIYLYESSHYATNLKYIDSSNNQCQWEKIKQEFTKEAEENKANGLESPIVVLDYLHLIQGNPKEDTQSTIKRIVAEAKEYALKYDSIVFLISAISKSDSEKEDDSSVMEGRDTTAIGYSADKIFKLYPETIKEGTERTEVVGTSSKGTYRSIKLNVVKNRMGKAKEIILLKFYPSFNFFE